MEWSARVEWSTPESYDEDHLDEFLTVLAPHAAAIGCERTPEGVPETWSAQLHIEAPSLRKAVAAACALIEATVGQAVTGVEVISASVFAHRVELPELTWTRRHALE